MAEAEAEAAPASGWTGRSKSMRRTFLGSDLGSFTLAILPAAHSRPLPLAALADKTLVPSTSTAIMAAPPGATSTLPPGLQSFRALCTTGLTASRAVLAS